jgi:hypothetical protein
MYKVSTKDGFVLNASPTLEDAMEYAKAYGEFLIISNGDMEIVGKFGVDSPSKDYEWSKDYSPGKRKAKKVWERDDTKEDDR